MPKIAFLDSSHDLILDSKVLKSGFGQRMIVDLKFNSGSIVALSEVSLNTANGIEQVDRTYSLFDLTSGFTGFGTNKCEKLISGTGIRERQFFEPHSTQPRFTFSSFGIDSLFFYGAEASRDVDFNADRSARSVGNAIEIRDSEGLRSEFGVSLEHKSTIVRSTFSNNGKLLCVVTNWTDLSDYAYSSRPPFHSRIFILNADSGAELFSKDFEEVATAKVSNDGHFLLLFLKRKAEALKPDDNFDFEVFDIESGKTVKIGSGIGATFIEKC